MATGIIEVFAKAGYDVLFVTRGEDRVTRVRGAIERSLDKGVLRGKLTQEERDAALARITGSARIDDLVDCDLVVEAVVEELSVKAALFETFDEICKPGAILATTTSSLPVVDLAAVTKRPHDVVGLHFFNPAPVMKLVEVVHDGRHRRRRRRHRRRGVPPSRQAPGHAAATARASSSTRCCSRTSTTPCACSRSTTPTPTTSTPP